MKLDELPALSPYIFQAFYEWCVDFNYTPLIVVDVTRNQELLQAPVELAKNGLIVFNIDHEACSNLKFGYDYVSFDASFDGVADHVFVPIGNIKNIFAQEAEYGLSLDDFPHKFKKKTKKTDSGRKPPVFSEIK